MTVTRGTDYYIVGQDAEKIKTKAHEILGGTGKKGERPASGMATRRSVSWRSS